MRTTVGVVAVLGVVAVVVRRRRRGDVAPADAARPVDPLRIETSTDPDDIVALLAGAWTSLESEVAHVSALPVGGVRTDERARQSMQRLVIAATQLDAAETAVLWPAVAGMDGGEALATDAEGRSVELRRELQALDHVRPGDPAWAPRLQVVGRAVRDRHVWERTAVWPQLSRTLDDASRAELGRRVLAARQAAPTRPHVAVTGGRHRRLASAVARLDRVEDRLGSRG